MSTKFETDPEQLVRFKKKNAKYVGTIEKLYQNQKIGLLFSTEPQTTPEGERVEFVDVTVIVSEVAEDGSLKELYRKKRRIPVL